MNVVKSVALAVWNFFLAIGEARAQRELMHVEAIRKHYVGR